MLSQYVHTIWGLEKGFPGGSISSIAQSSDGYLWIGTDRGLIRFDGLNFQNFVQTIPTAFPIGAVKSLLVDGQGNLWILLQSTKLLRYHDGTFELSRGEAENGITAICRSATGTVLVSSLAKGTLAYNGKQFEAVSTSPVFADPVARANGVRPDEKSTHLSWSTGVTSHLLAVPTSAVTSMAATADGNIWLGTEDKGLVLQTTNRATAIPNGLPREKITSLLPLQGSELWIGTTEGVLRWTGTEFTRGGVPQALQHTEVFSLIRDRDSNIWAGTPHGLLRYNTSGVSLFSDEDSATSTPVNALFEDREQNLWIGGPRGLERLRDSAFVTYSVEDGLPSERTGPVYVDAEGRTWFAPLDGGLYWAKGKQHGSVADAGLARDVVYSISGRGNELWVGRQRGGLTVLHTNSGSVTARTYTDADGLAQNSVYTVYQSRDGTVWAGTLGNGVSAFRDGRFSTYSTANGLLSNTITSITESPDGTIWIATSSGLSSFSKGRWRAFTAKDGLLSAGLNCMLADSAGVLWLGSTAGIAFLTSDHVQVPQVPEPLREPVFGIAEDRSGWLWIATSNHVLRIKRNALLKNVYNDADVREYGLSDGLLGTEGVKRDRSVVADPQGRIWFSLNHGLSVVDPNRDAGDSAEALVHVETVTVDGDPLALKTPIQIPSAHQRITFGYTGLSLSDTERVRYRYRLDGFDHDWSAPTATRTATYTNLGPGSYRFRVIASNSNGLWNGEGGSLHFAIAPAYYETTWFRSLCAAAFLALVWALYRLRVQQLRREERKLRSVIETIPTFAWTALPDGSLDFVNRHWKEFTGFSTEKTAGSGWEAVVHPSDLNRYVEKWHVSLTTGEPFESEARYRHVADGQYRWFLARAVPCRDKRGKILKWYGISTDIEDRKRAEQLQADLAHVSRVSTLGELAASLAHEIKQPIAATITSADSCLRWLMHSPPNLDRARMAATRVKADGNRAANIIDRLRSLYKKAPPQRELVAVNEIIGEMVVLLRGEANRYAVSIRTDLPADTPKVLADRVQLQQVLMNLMLNGIEAMTDTGGILTVRSQSAKDSEVMITVSDTGIGLPAEKADQIFDAFFTTKPQGSGMGLAISRSIVESHSGRIWATANDGRGAAFHFTLSAAAGGMQISAAGPQSDAHQTTPQ